MDIEKLHNKKFNIFGSVWTIKIVDTIEGEVQEDGMHYYCGMTYDSSRIIELARNVYGDKMTKDEMFKTLCHELVHAILDSGAYHRCSGEEPMVEFLGRAIAELVRQNILCK